MKTSEFERKFDAGEAILGDVDGRRRGVPILRRGASTSTFPPGASRRWTAKPAASARQALVKLWIAERLDKT